jgi:hypothetical protein
VPPPYISSLKNPCWLENLPENFTYRDNVIAASHPKTQKELEAKLYSIQKKIKKHPGWRLRYLPFFYVAGVSKCGTTDLYDAIQWHPQVRKSLRKELVYWNRIRYDGEGCHIVSVSSEHVFAAFDMYYKYNYGNGPLYDLYPSVPRPFHHYVDAYDGVAEYISSFKGRTETITGVGALIN